MTKYNMFWVFFASGEGRKVEYPADWTSAEVLACERALEIDGPYPV